jgi:7-cyano-7-deazaguanine synthase
MHNAMVVLSGGQDSTTCLYWALQQGFGRVHAVSFDYGQRHAIELESAATIAQMAGVKTYKIFDIKGLLQSASPLTSSAELEQYTDYEQMDGVIGDRIEKTFVPMRNTLFLTIATNWALHFGCDTLITGVCQQDNANYPDCTQEFISSFEDTINFSLGNLSMDDLDEPKPPFRIVTPLMNLSKADTVRLAKTLPGCWEALAYSHTSYDGKYPPTDMNHSNVLRGQGFLEAGEADPLVIRAWMEGLMELPETENYKKYLETVKELERE